VWATRARAGRLFAADSTRLPIFKRYFLGGSNSVRGWGRYQISPLTDSGLPVGGRVLGEWSSELRVRLGAKLGLVGFVDAGLVGTGVDELRETGWRYAAGPGLRYDTPIGPVRVDLGVQLNPIDGLIIDGKPESRRWRVHFSIGQAF
jgi:outer membrane protein insertion porin family/translocation and assembly module TamA